METRGECRVAEGLKMLVYNWPALSSYPVVNFAISLRKIGLINSSV